MRAAYEKIIAPEQSSFLCRADWGPRFGAPLHFHPEFELTLILRGRGLRFVGDSIEPFAEGDFVLLGPDLPHFWRNDERPRPRPDEVGALCVQFAGDFAGPGFFALAECAAVRELLRGCGRGLCFEGQAAASVAARLVRLPELKGVSRLLEFLAILDALTSVGGARTLVSAGFTPVLNVADAARLNRVFDYIHRHLTGEISQPAAARAAHMGPVSFSRFFRQKTGRTFTAIVNALRVSHAVKLLMEGRENVTGACYASGFNNVSNFNRHFLALKGVNPREFVKRIRSADAPAVQTSIRS